MAPVVLDQERAGPERQLGELLGAAARHCQLVAQIK